MRVVGLMANTLSRLALKVNNVTLFLCRLVKLVSLSSVPRVKMPP